MKGKKKRVELYYKLVHLGSFLHKPFHFDIVNVHKHTLLIRIYYQKKVSINFIL